MNSKRKAQACSSERDEYATEPNRNCDGSEQEIETVTAAAVIKENHEQQKRRRMAKGGRGASVKTSVWSTHAATVLKEDSMFSFHCVVCGKNGKLNQTASNSNIVSHYKCMHPKTHKVLNALDKSNATDAQVRNAVTEARNAFVNKNRGAKISSFFKATPSQAEARMSGRDVRVSKPDPPARVVQPIATILYACATETPLSRIGAPMFQGLVSIFGGRVQFSSKSPLDNYLLPTYEAACKMLRSLTSRAMTGCITFDGWSAALGAPILGVTWHFVDTDWRLRCIPIAALNLGDAAKKGKALCALIESVMSNNIIVGSDNIRVHTATTDNEPATALAVDLFTNYVGSVRCAAHTLALAVNDVFQTGTQWQKYMDTVNSVTSYFNQNQKAYMLFRKKQRQRGVTSDRLQTLKHDIQTRWHSRLAALSSYLSCYDEIMAVAGELEVPSSRLRRLSTDELNTIAEFVTVLNEIRRVARQLEADRKVTMSRAPRILRELYETLLIMCGEMGYNEPGFFSDNGDGDLAAEDQEDVAQSHASIASIATADQERDDSRKVRLIKVHARKLAREFAQAIQRRLGHVWSQVSSSAAMWRPASSNDCDDDDGGDIDPTYHKPRRVLLYHIAAMLDVNECQLEFIDPHPLSRAAYIQVLRRAVVREVVELDNSMSSISSQLEVIYGMLHDHMLTSLQKNGRREPNMALQYWKDLNENPGIVSPVPFNMVAKACFAAQASSASAERLFSDLGKIENNQCQSLLSSTLEMTELLRVFVQNEVSGSLKLQSGFLHPEAAAFKRLVTQVATEVFNNE